MLAAHVQRPSEDLSRRTAELGEALVEARVSPQGFVAAHMACVEQLCASRAGGDGTALRGATSLLLEVMKAYGRRLQEPRGTPRPLAQQTHRLNETLAEAKQAQQAVQGGNSELRRRLEQHTAELAAANERLQQEIAERTQTEQVLRESEARYRQLFATVSDAIVVFDGETKQFVGVNDAAVRLYGYNREELLRLGLLDISAQPEESRIAAEEALAGELIRIPLRYHKKKDGTVFPVEIAASVLAFANRRLLCGVVRDITERKRAEETLQESEARYRSFTLDVLDTSMVGVLVLDNQFRVRWVNQALERYFGLRRNEVLGKDKRELVRQRIKNLFEDSETFAERVLATYKNNTYVQNFECHVLAGDSREERWLEHWSQPIRSGLYAGGRIEHYADITERKRAEELLRESEQRYRALFEQAADAILLVDGDTGGLVEFNDRAHERLGYTREEFRKLKIADIEVTESPEEIARHIAAIYKSGAETFETKHRTKTGEIRNVLVNSRVIPVGQKLLFQTIWTDITEQKQAAAALAESKERYRALFEQAPDSIVLVDAARGAPVEFNDRACENLGYTRAEFRNLTMADLEAIESSDEVVAHTERIIREGADTFETKQRTKTGEIRDVLIISRAVSIGGRDFALGIWRDVTERKRAEEQARQREAELAHVSRLTLMGEMASSLSHDISQPLSTILFYARGCVRRMRSGAADPAALLDVMEKVALQAEAAGRIVRRLREFVSKRAPHLSTVDVNDVVRRSLSLVQSEISEGRITVRFQAAESLPPVRADRVQIEQVILNLVRNSAEALQDVEAGQRELTITTSSSAGDTITVAVRDTGAGLSAEVAERVFDSFFSTKPDGMGMGLSISRSIIEAHGGHLSVVPNAERGATFQFSLPVMGRTGDEGA